MFDWQTFVPLMKKPPKSILTDQDPWVTFRSSSLRSLSPLEDQAHGVLTPYAFKLFQVEFGSATLYSVLQENGSEFVLQYYKDKTIKKHKVLWDGEMTNCSCKHFEFWGILCRHILRIFLNKDCHQIPHMYLLSRWSCEASLKGKELLVLNDEDLVDMETNINGDVNDVIDEDCFISCPPMSKTKGRPKKKRMKGGRELGKQKKSCRLCKHIGQNISRCPEKNSGTSSNCANKKKKTTSTDIGLNPVFCLKC